MCSKGQFYLNLLISFSLKISKIKQHKIWAKGELAFKESLCLLVFIGTTVPQPGVTEKNHGKEEEKFYFRFRGMHATAKAGCSKTVSFQICIDV